MKFLLQPHKICKICWLRSRVNGGPLMVQCPVRNLLSNLIAEDPAIVGPSGVKFLQLFLGLPQFSRTSNVSAGTYRVERHRFEPQPILFISIIYLSLFRFALLFCLLVSLHRSLTRGSVAELRYQL